MPAPVVSVVMATKNAARYLPQTLDTLRNQSFQDFELVVVDGRSTDDTLEILEAYPQARVLKQINTGFSDAWNQAILETKGKFISILDSDDLWPNYKLEHQVNFLNLHHEYHGITGKVSFFVEEGRVIPNTFRASLKEGSYVAHMPSALMVRKEVFDRIGLFDPKLTIASDIDWFAKLKDSDLKIHIAVEEVIKKRVHDSNLSYTAAKDSVLDKEILITLRRSILRQRSEKQNEN